MAHRLYNSPDTKCFVPHGHNEVVTVTLLATNNKRLDGKENIVERFSKAKKLWHEWIDNYVDHAFQVAESDPLISFFSANEKSTLTRLMVMPGDPTTEILAVCFMAKISAFLKIQNLNLKCKDVMIEETTTNCVKFDGNPADFFPVNCLKERWWFRSDMSINEFSV